MTTVNHQLSHLETNGLVRLAQTTPELEYLFRHALVQDAAYASLLNTDRRQLHQTIGETLEALYPDRLDELSALLGHHFALAGDNQRAYSYFIQAGDTAVSAYANKEAIVHYSRAVELARDIGVDGQGWIAVYGRLGRALELDSQFGQAVILYEEMEQLAKELQDPALELASLAARIAILAIPTAVADQQRALITGERALLLTRSLNDQKTEAQILWQMSLAHVHIGNIEASIVCGERGLELARRLDLRQQIAQSLHDLGSHSYTYSARFQQSISALSEAAQMWREFNNLPMLADSLSSACINHVFIGNYTKAIALSTEALQISRAIDNIWGQSYSGFKVGMAYWDQGDPDKAITTAKQCISLAISANFTAPATITRADLALSYAFLGDYERSTAMIQSVVKYTTQFSVIELALGIMAQIYLMQGCVKKAEEIIARKIEILDENRWPLFFVYMAMAECQLSLAQNKKEQALAQTTKLLVDLRRYGMRAYYPEALYLQGYAYLGLGKLETARQQWREGLAEAMALNGRWMQWQLLALLSDHVDDAVEKQQLKAEAQAIVSSIAERTPPELRKMFLKRPLLRAIFG